MINKILDMHRNPVNCFLHLVAAIVVAVALWHHNVTWILLGLLIAVIGHIIQAISERKPTKKSKKKRKKGALQLSIGTIVIIVLAIVMLVLGIVFVRSIMCAGIIMTGDLSTGVQNEIRDLFGADDYGVKCMGEGSQEIKIGSGGTRRIFCIIKTEDQEEYKLTTDIDSIDGAPKSTVKSWIKDQDARVDVSPGKDAEVVIAIMEIPRNAPKTTLKITTQAKNINTGTETTHVSFIDIVPVGYFKGAIC